VNRILPKDFVGSRWKLPYYSSQKRITGAAKVGEKFGTSRPPNPNGDGEVLNSWHSPSCATRQCRRPQYSLAGALPVLPCDVFPDASSHAAGCFKRVTVLYDSFTFSKTELNYDTDKPASIIREGSVDEDESRL
jgi:hypothetical protein